MKCVKKYKAKKGKNASGVPPGDSGEPCQMSIQLLKKCKILFPAVKSKEGESFIELKTSGESEAKFLMLFSTQSPLLLVETYIKLKLT